MLNFHVCCMSLSNFWLKLWWLLSLLQFLGCQGSWSDKSKRWKGYQGTRACQRWQHSNFFHPRSWWLWIWALGKRTYFRTPMLSVTSCRRSWPCHNLLSESECFLLLLGWKCERFFHEVNSIFLSCINIFPCFYGFQKAIGMQLLRRKDNPEHKVNLCWW